MKEEWKPSECLPEKSGKYKVKWRDNYTGDRNQKTYKLDMSCIKCRLEFMRKVEYWR